MPLSSVLGERQTVLCALKSPETRTEMSLSCTNSSAFTSSSGSCSFNLASQLREHRSTVSSSNACESSVGCGSDKAGASSSSSYSESESSSPTSRESIHFSLLGLVGRQLWVSALLWVPEADLVCMPEGPATGSSETSTVMASSELSVPRGVAPEVLLWDNNEHCYCGC